MLNKDYDYSKYMTTCTIRIANCLNTIDFDRDNSLDHFVNKEAIYVKIENESFSAHRTMPLDFYSEDDEQLDSLHIEDFLGELYQMYESAACRPTMKDGTFIYLAIIKFLRDINPYDVLNVSEKDKKLTQLAMILPVKYWNEGFIEKTLRPACTQAGWISVDDDRSKLIFSNELQCRMIYLQNEKKVLTWDVDNSLLRERKYISCSIQCVPHQALVVLSLNLFRMQYDTDFVKLCVSNRSQLRDAFFSPTHLGPTTTIELPLPSLTGMLHKLKEFLASRLSEPLEAVDDALLQTLLYSLTINLYHYSQQESPLDPHLFSIANEYGHRVMTQAQIDLLSSLTTHDILNCLPDVVGVDIYTYLDKYMQENQLVDENFAGIFIYTDSNVMKQSQGGTFQLYTDPENEYSDHQMGYGAALYLEKIQQKVKEAMTDSTRFIGFAHTSKSMWPMTEYGMRYKIYKMVDLTSKLIQPQVIGQTTIRKATTPSTININSFLQDLPPYSLYAEAKITKHQTIKLLLHQVICLTSTGDMLEKSTLEIDQVSIDFGDMYASICESIWLLVVDGWLKTRSCKTDSEDKICSVQNYTHFCEQLSSQLQKIFTDTINESHQSLDTTVYIQYHSSCQICSVGLSRRTILDHGLKPYVNTIANLMLAGIQSKAAFGNHKIVRLLVTGSMLATWMTSFNPMYQDYIWKQLEEDLLLGIHSSQLRVNLVMHRSDLQKASFYDDNCYSKKQVFHQVSSKSYYLEMICCGSTSAEVYTVDQDDTYTKLQSTMANGLQTWRLLVTQSECDVLKKEGITKTMYFRFKRQADGLIEVENEEHPIIYILGMCFASKSQSMYCTNIASWCMKKVLIALPFSVNQAQLNDSSWISPTENTVLINILESLPSLEALSKQTTFPMTVHVKPCHNTSKLELATGLGVDDAAGADDPLGFRKVYISERLSLKQQL
ncbi:hypothetical protein MBANPS3_011036 [Mucor bainieri]